MPAVARSRVRSCVGTIATLVLIGACSSGGGDDAAGPGDAGDLGDGAFDGAGAGGGGGGGGDFVLLPRGDEPNVPSPNIASRNGGPLHAAWADISGNVFYARCDADCGREASWSSARITAAALEPTGHVTAKIALGADGTPHLAWYATLGGSVLDPGTTSYARCDGDCLDPDGWSGGVVHANGGTHSEHRLGDEDWFALDALDRPRLAFLEKPEPLSGDARALLVGCDARCADPASWTSRELVPEEFASSASMSIAFGPDGATHLSYVRLPIGGSNSTIVWLGCPGDCLAGAQIIGPVDLLERPEALALNETSLAIGPGGAPSIVSFEDDTSSLTLLRCTDACGSGAGWNRLPLGERLVHDVDVSVAGRGVDARFRGDALELAYAAKERGRPVTDLVVRARCDAECLAGRAGAPAAIAASTDVELPDEAICAYAGTFAGGPMSLVDGGVGFVATPQWTCGIDPVEVVTPDGDTYLDYGADVRFLELGAFAADP